MACAGILSSSRLQGPPGAHGHLVHPQPFTRPYILPNAGSVHIGISSPTGHMVSDYPAHQPLGPAQVLTVSRRSPFPPREEWHRRDPVDGLEWDRKRGRPPFKNYAHPPSHLYQSRARSRSGSANCLVQREPTDSIHIPPSRALDKDYDEGIVDTLIGTAHGILASSPPPADLGVSAGWQERPCLSTSPSSLHLAQASNNKHPLSPGPDNHIDAKQTLLGA
ncbi:hypothetical protein C8Q74DRAFT_1374192 [Fomes fomentarius]|nr:hypothetical protein C8Q74DRAFT_1374192 [Fomes fomentarius]